MSEFMVTVVWDLATEDVESGLEELDGAWVASSAGRLVTGLPVSAEGPSAAFEYAFISAKPFVGGAAPIGFAVEPVSSAVHFRLARPLS
jgi:hypothetical protein